MKRCRHDTAPGHHGFGRDRADDGEAAPCHLRLSKRDWGLNLSRSLFAQLLPSSVVVLSTNFQASGPQTGFVDAGYAALLDELAMETESGRQKAVYARLNDVLLDQCLLLPISATVPGC